jgi:hypothetical protein
MAGTETGALQIAGAPDFFIQTTIVLREKGKPDTYMAEFIPDRLPSRATRGEERTFALLKKLPDDYLIYYEPTIDNRHLGVTRG